MNDEQTSMKLVTIAIASQSHTAYMLKAFLEEEGIVVFLHDELLNQLYWGAVGGVKIQVSDIDVEKAHNLFIEGGYAEYLI